MLTHPIIIVLYFKGIRRVAMHKNVLKKLALRFKPARDFAIQRLVIAHMFKHLDRDNAIVSAWRFKHVHIGRNNVEIGDAKRFSHCCNVFALGV